MNSRRVTDGELFRKNVEIHSGEEWEDAARLAAATGILVGRDGPRSRGIYCGICRFGFRREFGPYPVVEARTSLANDFMDEAHRRECPHWKTYVSHPDAFGRPRRADLPARFPAEGEGLRTCQRCGQPANALFRCLETRVCFRCLGEVLQFTGGFRGFRSIMTVEAVPDPAGRRRRRLLREPGIGRCRTCHAYGKVIRIQGRNYCRPCATAKVEKLLAK